MPRERLNSEDLDAAYGLDAARCARRLWEVTVTHQDTTKGSATVYVRANIKERAQRIAILIIADHTRGRTSKLHATATLHTKTPASQDTRAAKFTPAHGFTTFAAMKV